MKKQYKFDDLMNITTTRPNSTTENFNNFLKGPYSNIVDMALDMSEKIRDMSNDIDVLEKVVMDLGKENEELRNQISDIESKKSDKSKSPESEGESKGIPRLPDLVPPYPFEGMNTNTFWDNIKTAGGRQTTIDKRKDMIKAIEKSPSWAYKYAIHMKEQFKPGEDAIAKDPYLKEKYEQRFKCKIGGKSKK